MGIWKRLLGLVIGLIFGAIYGFIALLSTGGGHGNFIWIMMFFPTMFGLLVFPVIGFLAVDLKARIYRIIFVLVMLFHYVGIFIQLYGSESLLRDTRKIWALEPQVTILGASIYLLIQLFIWAFFVRGLLSAPATDDGIVKTLA
jgi:hypothetical protein